MCLELMRRSQCVNWINWPLSSDVSVFWQDAGVADEGGRSEKVAEPDPGVCVWQSSKAQAR